MKTPQSNIVSYKVSSQAMDETIKFLRSRGSQRFEGLAFWVGSVNQVGVATVSRIHIPEQVGIRTPNGVAVEMTSKGQLEFIKSLKNGEVGLVKIHSHPDRAYLSSTDQNNPSFCFEGAMSIVVPNYAFCINSLRDLTKCAVFRRRNYKWEQLDVQDISKVFCIGGAS